MRQQMTGEVFPNDDETDAATLEEPQAVETGEPTEGTLESTEESEPPVRAKIGVLFVHGMGDQKRGETLSGAGQALYSWVESWVNHGSNRPANQTLVYMSDTRLLRAIPSEQDAPAYTRVWFAKDSGKPRRSDEHWILAESWWSGEYTAPPYKELVPWALVLAPEMVFRGALALLQRLLPMMYSMMAHHRARIDITTSWPLRAIPYIFLAITWLFVILVTVLMIIAGAVVFIGGSTVVLLLIVALLALGLIPPLRDFVVQTQLHLAGSFGDNYLLASSPLIYNSMCSQVARDISWLKDPRKGNCEHVAVVAHSQGAAVSYGALAGPHNDGVDLFISYGSGQGKLDTLTKRVQGRTGSFTYLPFFRLVFLSALIASAFLLSIFPAADTRLPWILAFSASLVLLGLTLGQYWLKDGAPSTAPNSDVLTCPRTSPADPRHGRFCPDFPKTATWKDYLAIADTIADYKIDAYRIPNHSQSEAKGEWIGVSGFVHNLHSLMQDHSSYWQNGEEFVSDVARTISRVVPGADIVGSDSAVLEAAKRMRRNRVYAFFLAGMVAVFSIPLIAASLWSQLLALSGSLGGFLAEIDFIKSSLGLPWNLPGLASVTAVSIVALLVFLWHQLGLFQFWRSWSRADSAQMYARSQVPARGPAWLYFTFSLLLPLFVFFVTHTSRTEIDPEGQLSTVVQWLSSGLLIIAVSIAALSLIVHFSTDGPE